MMVLHKKIKTLCALYAFFALSAVSSLTTGCSSNQPVRAQDTVVVKPLASGSPSHPEPPLHPPLTMRWKTQMKGPLLSVPVIQGTTIFMPLPDNKLYRMNTTTGDYERIGKFKGTAPVRPVMEGDIIYLSLTGPLKKEKTQLIAYDLRQKSVKWQSPIQNGWSTPVLVDSTLFVGAEDGGLYAIDARSGKNRWKFMAKRQIRSSPVVSAGLVFAGSNDNNLYAVDQTTGELRWSFEAGESISVTPVVTGQMIYAVSYDKTLYCLDKLSGKLQWKFFTNGSLYSAPSVQNDRIFLGSNNRMLYCLEARTGKLLWHYEADGMFIASPFPDESIVYAGSTDRRLYAFDITTGKVVWQYETEGSITVQPFRVNNLLLVGSEDRYIYAFGGE